jgi:hypothetical protein
MLNRPRMLSLMRGDVMDLSLRTFDVQVAGVLNPTGPSMPEPLLVIDRVDGFRRQATAHESP